MKKKFKFGEAMVREYNHNPNASKVSIETREAIIDITFKPAASHILYGLADKKKRK